MTKTIRSAQEIDADLEVAVRNYRRNLRRIGELLNEAAAAGLPMAPRFDFLRNAGISKATANVAMRWASGELGDENEAVLVVQKIPHAVLANMGNATIQTVLSKPHVIYSRLEGRIAQKLLKDMDRVEVVDNIDASGFRPLKETVPRPPEERAHKARTIKLSADGSVLISAGRDDEILIRLSGAQLDKLRKVLDQAKGAEPPA